MKKSQTSEFHQPVLLQEVIKLLAVKPGQWYVDATLGGAGHTTKILKRKGKVLGIDWDKEALRAAKEHLSLVCPDAPWRLFQGNFTQLEEIVLKAKLNRIKGILFDLGVSSYQLGGHGRGFSFQVNEELDMRMDPEKQQVTAKDLLAALNEGELREIFEKFAQEALAKPIARRIVLERQRIPIQTTLQLKKLIWEVYRRKQRGKRIDPATKVFQALRIAVNDELHNLESGLAKAWLVLAKGGRLVVISFHEGEDRIVKNQFREWAKNGLGKILTNKPIQAQSLEIIKNPRSRSAKLRAIIKK